MAKGILSEDQLRIALLEQMKASQPMGLFRPADATAPRGPMLLLTWYDSFNSWELSRSPHPDATANFNRRRALSRSVIAYATRLADPPAA